MATDTEQKIPVGYKQTEVGVIPEDWDVFEFRKIVKSKQLGGNYKNGERETSWPLIKMGNIGRGKIKLDKLEYIESNITPSERDLLVEGDILFNTRNTLDLVGKVSVWRSELPVAYFNSNIMRIEFDDSLVSSNYFINYVFNTRRTLSDLRGIAIGTTSVAAIYSRDLDIIKFPIPSNSEQIAIATALSDTDTLIESLEKLIAKKRAIKQGAMQELLTGKRRLPGFSGEWEKKKLGELGEISGSGIDKKSSNDETPIRLVNFLDVFHKDYIYSKDLGHWVTASPAQIQRCSVKKGDVFFTPSSEMRYDIAVSAVAMEDISDAGYSYHVVRFRLFEDWDIAFRTYIFKAKDFLNQAETICEGSGKRYVISLSKFREMKIKYPRDKKEQAAISTVLLDVDKQIWALEKKLVKYRQLKIGMMQQLLTGKIRIYAKQK